MPLQHAVLALLADHPGYGHQLKLDLEATVGPQWGPLPIGRLYQVLDRLAHDGLVSSERLPQQVRPDRVLYAITDAGREELRVWLDTPSPRTDGFRDDTSLRLMAAVRTGDAELVRSVLSSQRAYLLRELHELRNRRAEPAEPLVILFLAAAARHVSADLSFLDDAEQTLLTDPAVLAEVSGPSPAIPTQLPGQHPPTPA